MSHEFQPRDFIRIANHLKLHDEEAAWRTAVGRAYYAVYGTVKTAYCVHNNIEQDCEWEEFGHYTVREVIRRMDRKDLRRDWGRMISYRENSDYIYDRPIVQGLAKLAIDVATSTINALEYANEQIYDPVSPPRRPRRPPEIILTPRS